MTNCKPATTPLPSDFRPVAATDGEFEQARHLDFPVLAGSILYAATISRPDLSFAASVLCRYISKWSEAHYKAAKHCLRYIRGTTDLCLMFDATGSNRVAMGYADSDWGGCLDTRRSTTGYVFETYGGVVSWKSRRQPSVALSTTQAEVLAVTDAARQAEWLRQLLDDLGVGLGEKPMPIMNDNSGAVLLSNHPHNHGANKHFDIRTNYLREKTHGNAIKIEHIGTTDNKADGFTKSVGPSRHIELRDRLHVQARV
jgi:hypothetical protein